jgi:hypothetical protein
MSIERSDASRTEVEPVETAAVGPDQAAVPTFRCECARLDCNSLVSLTPREYQRVRASSRRFVAIPGHEIEDRETVVQRGSDYIVVEKRDEAGRLAEASDPRT